MPQVYILLQCNIAHSLTFFTIHLTVLLRTAINSPHPSILSPICLIQRQVNFSMVLLFHIVIPGPRLQLMQIGICLTEANDIKVPSTSWEPGLCTQCMSSVSMELKM